MKINMEKKLICLAAILALVLISGCLEPPKPVEKCGDSNCSAGENWKICPADCPQPLFCGDDTCSETENWKNCEADCPKPAVSFCGDKVCDAKETANPKLCPKDCPTVSACPDGICDAKENANTTLCPQDCLQIQTHTECKNQLCTTVNGTGTNQCASDSDCTTQPQTHKACQNQQCTTVDGAGTDECSTNSDCIAQTHKACQNQQCVSVSGAGTDECSINSDCAEPNNCGNGTCDAGETPVTCPLDCPGGEPNIPHYIIVIHVNPVNVKEPGSAKANEFLSGFYQRTKQEVEYANKYNIKLSLWFSAVVAEYVSQRPELLSEVKEWEQQGHEIGLHHHSTYRNTDWDGYTSMPESEAINIRKNLVENPETYKGTLDDMMDILKKLNPNIKSGISSEQYNKNDAMPDEIIYSTGAGYANYGEPGTWAPSDPEVNNEFISTALVNGIKRKWLTHFVIGSIDKVEEVEKKFEESNSKAVFSVVTHNSAGNVEVLKEFLDFLHTKDSEGKNSRTVSEAMESNILPEYEIDLRCEKLNGVVCNAQQSWQGKSTQKCSTGKWLIDETINGNLYQCCSGYCINPKVGGENSIQPYFIAIHSEPAAISETNYKVLKEFVARANTYNIKLTLMFSDTWADYIAASQARMAELQEWKGQGHEIAGHHHSIYHGAWDGYTNYTKEEAIAQRIKQGATPEPYLGTLDDLMDKLKQINPGMNSGCMNNEENMKDLPNEIIYDTCSGFYNFGEPGREYYAADSELAKNEYVSVGIVDGIERKWLTHGPITDATKQQAVKEIFETANSGVLGAVIHATRGKNQDQLLLDFLDFIHEKDPTGAKSMTLTEIIESEMLPEEEIEIK